MEAIKLFEKTKARLEWEYDEDADALYLSFARPRRINLTGGPAGRDHVYPAVSFEEL